MTNPRGKLFCFILYPENENHQRVITLLKERYNILGIFHDRDVWEETDEEKGQIEGEPKKPHHHIMVKFENARYKNALAKELGCESNLIQKIGSFKSMAIYFLHRDYPQKAQYKPSELYGLLIDDAMKCLGRSEEDVQVLEIISFLKELNHYLTFPEFIEWICTHGYWSTYRRSASTIERIYYFYQGKYL